MSSVSVETLFKRNETLSKTYSAKPLLSEAKAAGAIPPSVIVITCCDIRCDPTEFLNLKPADAIILRNVGGKVAPLVKDIVILDAFIGMKEIMLIHHTDCGTTHYKDQTIRDVVNARCPGAVDEKTTFAATHNLEQSVRDNIAILKNSTLVRPDLANRTSGFIFDLKTGLLCAVE
jgi:carbonic anhydrase